MFFQDEVHFQLESTKTRMWAGKGKQPLVKSYAGRKSCAYSGYVNGSTGELVVNEMTWFNYETTIESIREFLKFRPEGRKVVLVMDNAPWHKKAIRLIRTDDAYLDIRERIEILSLPPYSPDLNPIERVWRITRREQTHNHFFEDRETLASRLVSYFKRFVEPNKKLALLCSVKSKS